MTPDRDNTSHYFWQVADGFWGHVYAIFEGVFWPAYMVFDAFGALRG